MSISTEKPIEEQLRQQNRYMAALHEVTLGLIQNLDLERLLEVTISHAASLVDTPHAFIDVVDSKRGDMQLRTALGSFREHLGGWIKPNEGFAGRVLTSGQTLICEDYFEFPGKLPGFEFVRTLICVPLRSGSGVIGVIGLGFDHVTTINPEHVNLLNQFAQLASLALRNAQLYAAAQQELAERKRVERELTHYRDNLEEVVNERTMELLEANAKLHFEIMDRYRIEKALRASEERYRLLIENAPVGILSTDTLGNLFSINSAAIQLLDEPVLTSAVDINLFEIPSLIGAGLGDALRRCLETETPLITELLFERESGHDSYFRFHITPIEGDADNIGGLQIIFEDISDRKRAEVAKNSAYERLKELHKLKDEFIDSISHELRTPITNLKLYHYLLDRKPDQHAEYLSKLNEQTMRLEHVVEGILALSEIKEELKSVHASMFDLRLLLVQVIGDYGMRAASRNLALRMDTHETQRAYGDPVLLGRVLTILLDNSLNYTPAGGQVMVSILAEERDGCQWAGFRVGNTGPQIPAEEVPHIFDRFYRGRAALDTKTPGAGLGLAVAKDIVDALQGRIEIVTEDGDKPITAFYVWLPVDEEASRQRPTLTESV